MHKLRLERIVKRYEDYQWELQIDLSIADGEIVTLLGPSGCGKTTTLRIIAGFLPPDTGHVWLEDADITHVPPYRRNIGVVFQDYALFPHMTVAQNIAFGMRMKTDYTRQTIATRVDELLELVGLEGYEKRYPEHLSGGEQQRIALLRALAPYPNMLLLDEPLSALDYQLRKHLRQEIKKIQRQLDITMLYVTHDQEEAMSISDRLVVMNDGNVEQIGPPAEVYHAPKTRHVAQFVGMSNILSGTILACDPHTMTVQTPNQTFSIPRQHDCQPKQAVTFFFRPEDAYLSKKRQEQNVIQGRIVEHEYLGGEILTHIEAHKGKVYVVSNYIKNETFIAHEGRQVYINIPTDSCKTLQE
jgi:ABC-type Fe3+/spermidine/putrescine transport system ATPase subunit